jgi:uncharacterized membrane protein
MRTRTYRTLAELGGFLGLLVAIFAALEVYVSGLSNACSFSSIVSCTGVLQSGKTTTLGVQDWVWGLAGFLAIVVLTALAGRRRKDARIVYALLALTTAGVGLAAYLLYVEVGEIHIICPVCVSAYAFGVIAWVGAIGLARSAYRRAHSAPDPTATAT